MPEPGVRVLDGVHVVIVDDNVDARHVLDSFLSHHGAVVTTAATASEALGLLGEVRAHVILSDIAMPGMDGLEFLRRMRAMSAEAQRPTPAIAITAFEDNAHRAREAGFAAFFVKPVDPLVIIDEIAWLLREPGESE
jgi:CheY-like chemotaxis protein